MNEFSSLSKSVEGAHDVKESFDITDVDLPLPESVPEIKAAASEVLKALTPLVEKLLTVLELAMSKNYFYKKLK